MKKLIEMYNNKYGNKYGIIDDDLTKEDMYKVCSMIKNICKNDMEIMSKLNNVSLPKPSTPSESLGFAESNLPIRMNEIEYFEIQINDMNGFMEAIINYDYLQDYVDCDVTVYNRLIEKCQAKEVNGIKFIYEFSESEFASGYGMNQSDDGMEFSFKIETYSLEDGIVFSNILVTDTSIDTYSGYMYYSNNRSIYTNEISISRNSLDFDELSDMKLTLNSKLYKRTFDEIELLSYGSFVNGILTSTKPLPIKTSDIGVLLVEGSRVYATYTDNTGDFTELSFIKAQQSDDGSITLNGYLSGTFSITFNEDMTFKIDATNNITKQFKSLILSPINLKAEDIGINPSQGKVLSVDSSGNTEWISVNLNESINEDLGVLNNTVYLPSELPPIPSDITNYVIIKHSDNSYALYSVLADYLVGDELVIMNDKTFGKVLKLKVSGSPFDKYVVSNGSWSRLKNYYHFTMDDVVNVITNNFVVKDVTITPSVVYEIKYTNKRIEKQQLRGTTDEIKQYIGKEGQIVVNKDTNSICIMDGVTKGGHDLKKYISDMISFNESGELVVTINGVSKTFVPKV